MMPNRRTTILMKKKYSDNEELRKERTLRILMVEDVPRDADMAVRELRRAGIACEARVVATREDMLRELDALAPDIILSDYAIPQFSGMEVLQIRNEHVPDLPFVIVTASINEETAVKCIKRGADDYVIKQHLIGLPHAVESALEKKRLERSEREAQEQLKLAAYQWRTTFDAMHHAVALLDPDQKILRCNMALRELTGKPWDKIIGQSCCQLVHGFAEPPAPCPVRRSKHTLQRENWQTSIGDRWFDSAADPILDQEGRLTGMVHVFTDITERKRAEEALRESESRYRFFFENVEVGIVISSFSGEVLAMNEAMSLATGYTLEEVSRVNLNDTYVNPEDRKRFLEILKRKGRVENFETRVRRKNGEVLWVSLSSRKTDYEGKATILTSALDITRQKQVENALQESEEKYRMLVENAGEVVLVAQEGLLKFVNRRVLDLLGYDPEEVIGNPFIDYIHPEDRETVAERHVKRLKGEDLPGAYSFRIIDKAGKTKWADINAVRIMWEGKPATLNFLEDITERKRAEEDRKKLEEQFLQAQKMESVGRLAGGVAHDFNNMLSVILGRTEIALDGMDTEDALHDELQEVLKAAQRSTGITRQLLAFARKQTIDPRVLDLNNTVEGMLKMLRSLIGEDVDLTWQPARNLWPVKMDPAQIDQMLANLCVNARDAIEGPGNITIETENVVLDEAYCAEHAGFTPGEYVMLAVSDNGSGMDKKTLDNIFEPFFTTKGLHKGTGLGLSTVYGIVKQNKGFINVYSEPHEGTTFKIYLPRHTGRAEAAPGETEDQVLQARGEVILMVEDEPSVLAVGKKILERLGYTVLPAGGPSEAVDTAQGYEGEIHMLVTDMVMPEMSGKDLAEEIARTRPNIRILFMSGYTSKAIVHRRALDEGEYFIQKPFTPDSLARKVREVLDGTMSRGTHEGRPSRTR